VNKRDVFFIVSLACLGIFILLGAYLWKDNYVNAKTADSNQESYSGQVEGQRNEEKSAGAARTGQTEPAGSVPAAKNLGPAATAGKGQNQPANPDSVPNPSSNPSLSAAAKINSILTSESKVGDVIKLGDVEMIITKSTSRHKIIDITLKGNTPEQPPKLIMAKNNRIIYEIPANVDVNVNVTEKTVIDRSPLSYGGEKPGKS